MVETYWHVGRLIIEEEQRGKQRAEYGEELIKKLSQDLIKKFGKGFTTANLWNMRQFYSIYPKLYAVRREFRDDKLNFSPFTLFRVRMTGSEKTEILRAFSALRMTINRF